MDLKTLSEVELKALGYEQMSLLQQTQQNLALINQELASRSVVATKTASEKKK